MAASVRIEDEAFSDIRYDVLATACQLADADHARGKMLNLWRQCTAQARHVLPRSMIVAVLGKDGPLGIVEAGLGEEHPEGIRIKGTEGRIEWLAKLRGNAAKGGAAKAAKRLPIGSPEGSQEATQTPAIRSANRVPPPCPPTPAPTPVLTEIREPAPDGALKSFKAKVDRASRLPSKGPLPSDWTPSGACRDRARDLRLDLSHESEQFSASARAHGRRYADWDAAFRTWLGNAAKWRDERGGPRVSAQSEIRTNLQPL